MTASAPAGVILERGQTIDRFVVLALVGRGGMGEVYAAYDPELDRKVAIKLLRARGDSAEGRARLLREAQAIAKLQHPNVVVVYDVGTFRDSVFIAMEFVEGRTVGGWLLAATRTRREILDVYLAAGRGLAAAHAAGLVHRDFKPDNVMVTNDGQVRVMDFGLARQMGESDGAGAGAALAAEAHELQDSINPPIDLDATADLGKSSGVGRSSARYLSLKLTQTGVMLGTPAYMAPEQFAGTSTDARTDQFSLCVALYEALYGQRPFAGDTFVTLMANVTTGLVGAAPAKARVPGWTRKVLLRGLSTPPDLRYPSMTALLAALETDPRRRARRAGLAAGAVLCVGLVALGAARLGGARRDLCAGGAERFAGAWEAEGTSAPRRDAVRGAFAATGKSYAAQAFAGAARLLDAYAARWIGTYRETCEATQVRAEQSAEVLDLRMTCLQDRLAAVKALTDVFASADGTTVDNAVSAAGALPSLDRCADVASLKAVIKPPADEATRRKVDALRAEQMHLSALIDAGRCGDAVQLADPLLAKVRAVGYLPLLADSLLTATFRTNNCITTDLALTRYREAFSVALAAHHDDVAAEAAIQVSGAMSQFPASPQFHEAAEWLRIGRAMLARIGSRPRLEAWAEVDEGTIAMGEGRWEDAAVALERSGRDKEKAYGRDHPDVYLSMENLGNALEYAGRYEDALHTDVEARVGETQLLGNDHPFVAAISSNEGEVLNLLGRYPEAVAACERALRIWTLVGADDAYLSYALTGLGIARVGEHRSAAAIEPLERALAIRVDKHMEPEILGETRFALARAIWRRAPDRALALARQARVDYGAAKTAPAVHTRDAIDAWLRAPGDRT